MDSIIQLISIEMYNADGLWAYILLFVISSAPVVKIFMVIPIGIYFELNPIGVALAVFLAKIIQVHFIIIGYCRIRNFHDRFISKISYNELHKSLIKRKALEIWNKYGVQGLSIISPWIIGTNLGTIMALGFGTRGSVIGAWMFLSLLLWTIVITFISYYIV
ncbi:hypothetical protein [Methanosalsum zhilinae]|nr:hypothetical protein [Methanosalsum zhilinae]